MHWQVMIPIRGDGTDKTRLRHAAFGQQARSDLVTAIQRDTIAAVVAAQELMRSNSCDISTITVLTNSVGFVPPTDVGIQTSGAVGLNGTLRDGESSLRQRHPEHGIVAVMADLPALSATEFAELLSSASHHARAFVPDQAGTGTTMLASNAGSLLEPQFGLDSARRHRQSGAEALAAGLGARCDVDTFADLSRCLSIGAGRHTVDVVQRIGVL